MEDKDLLLKIKFSKLLTEKEQDIFWDYFVEECEKIGITFGGGHDADGAEWVIDYSHWRGTINELRGKLYKMVENKSNLIEEFKLV